MFKLDVAYEINDENATPEEVAVFAAYFEQFGNEVPGMEHKETRLTKIEMKEEVIEIKGESKGKKK